MLFHPRLSKSEKSVLVGSVFYESERNEFWLKSQLEYLSNTTSSYDHVVFLNKQKHTSIFDKTKVVGVNNSQYMYNCSENHAYGLSKLLEYFRTTQYKYFLILDSDCWPIMQGWMRHLIYRMSNAGYEAASVVRYENLDVFPHPCACFFNANFLRQIKFSWGIGQCRNLLNGLVMDPGTKMNMSMFYPLVRTNAWNPHPICCAIYGNIFYHHGCGSRLASQRGVDYYGITAADNYKLEKGLFNKLKSDKDQFIKKLRLS